MIPLLSIAVCDDEALQRDMLEKMLREYYGENANIDVYSDGRRLLDAIERSGRDLYDIYILDVIMPAMTGIELGERLRGMGIRSPIIFLTNSKEYAVDSYSVRAFHYLIKPVTKEKMASVLNSAQELAARLSSDVTAVHTADGVVMINTSDILYAELFSRSVKYVLTDGSSVETIKLRTSFKNAVSGLLEHDRFVILGSSLLINLRCIKKVGKDELIFTNGTVLPISKCARKDLLENCMDYWLK